MIEEPVARGGFPTMRTWEEPAVRNPGGGAEYGDMISALRGFLDDVAAAAPDTEMTVALTKVLNAWSDRLADIRVPERNQIFARRLDLPGRGQTMSPNFIPTEGDAQAVRGTVTFGRYFLGGGGAVHGGAIPLLFDEVLGRLASSGARAPARTAYLHTDFRSITPVGEGFRFGPGSSTSRAANGCCVPSSNTATPCAPKRRDCSSSCGPTNPEGPHIRGPHLRGRR